MGDWRFRSGELRLLLNENEAVVRAFYGEPHLLEALGTEQRSQANYAALRHQLARHRWIGANPAPTIDRAKYLMMIWMDLTPSIE